MVIRELNDFVKSYQILITLLSPLSIQATPSPSTYSQDINRPRRDIKQLHDRNRRQTPRHEHLDRLLAPSLRTQRLQRRALASAYEETIQSNMSVSLGLGATKWA